MILFQKTNEIEGIYVPESVKSRLPHIKKEDIIECLSLPVIKQNREIKQVNTSAQEAPMDSMVFKEMGDNFCFDEEQNSAMVRLNVYDESSQALVTTKDAICSSSSEDTEQNNSRTHANNEKRTSMGVKVAREKIMNELNSTHRNYFIDINDIQDMTRVHSSDNVITCKGFYKKIKVTIKLLTTIRVDSVPKELLEEVNTLNMAEHANILKFIGIGISSNGYLAMITEYYEQSLYQALHESLAVKLKWRDCYKILMDIANGIAELNSRKCICQNLTSLNVFSVKPLSDSIGDGSILMKLDCYGPLKFLHLDNLLDVCWTAPEVLRKGPFTEKADVFAFGVLLWEVVTRLKPYEGLSTKQVVTYVSSLEGRPNEEVISTDCPSPVSYTHLTLPTNREV
eukprot:TRINITY_DN9600_c0_g1_i5.p1 TRINITY_DN9600_c0_g1~~TRINITY_DN9600_c0_g1_i5.p1  ORF type:complete len:397 (-),score=58.39 TRINITY_DN9600_c0_g1_i5:18-1208(-)